MKKSLILITAVALIGFFAYRSNNSQIQKSDVNQLKLYWFIPDGLRAEPDVFKLYEWAESGELPNIRKMMKMGARGYSKPHFPTHTPVNFASLLTGRLPLAHGVADGPMHTSGHSLDKVSIGGFSSRARKIPAIWTHFENQGLKVSLISIPGSTPPELNYGEVVRGRWGGWGVDLAALNFEYVGNNAQRYRHGRGKRLFFFGPKLTNYLDYVDVNPLSKSLGQKDLKFLSFNAWGTDFHGAINTSKKEFIFALPGTEESVPMAQGEWSNWYPVELEIKNLKISSQVRFHVIKLGENNFFRIRLLFNALNPTITHPGSLAKELTDEIGPMVDFVDNFPPQLIHYDEDKKTFLDELNFSFDWHTRAIPYFIKKKKSNVIIHDIYSPNQMLTSRWWLGLVDPRSRTYNTASESERRQAFDEVLSMYKRIDSMIGEILKNKGEDSIIVLSSDHGANVLHKWIRINNLLAKKGLLKYRIHEDTGEPVIDWGNTKAVFLKMDGVFINPKGLAGKWERASGLQYEKLRDEVRNILLELKDPAGIQVVTKVVNWEDAPEVFQLPVDRVGDLVVANRAGFGFNEEVTKSGEIFSKPLKSGYKQAILINETNAMWTPFIIMGPGIKRNYALTKPISHTDQLPTILKAMNSKISAEFDGKVLEEIFE